LLFGQGQDAAGHGWLLRLCACMVDGKIVPVYRF